MKVLARVFVAGLPVLAAWFLFEWICVTWPAVEASAISRPIGWVLLAALPISIFVALFRLAKKRVVRPSVAAIWMLLGTVVWGYLAWTLVINFRLAIGGGL